MSPRSTGPMSPRSEAPDAPRRGWLLLAVSLGTFATFLDNNVVNVAIPTIQRSLGLSEAGIEWVVGAYVLCFASLLLAGGRLADIVGHRRVYLAGLLGFVGASMLSGSAGSGGMLIAARGLQGAFAALLTPAALSLVTTTFTEPAERARAIALSGAVGALALAVGPLVGGVLTQYASWHWIFFVNGPIGALTLGLSLWAIPRARRASRERRFDLPGALVSAATLFGLTYGLIEGPEVGWSAPVVLAALVASAVGAAAFILVERRVTDPMVDLRLFAPRGVQTGTAALMAWAFGLFGIYLFTPIYLQDVLGFSPTSAGLALVPVAVCMALSAASSDRAVARLGAHRVIGGAMVLMAAGIASVSVLGSGTTFAELMPSFAVIGIASGLTIPLTTIVIGGLPDGVAGVASAVFNASREAAGLLGIAVIGAVISARRAALVRAGHAPLGAFLSGYHLGVVVAGAIVAVGGVIAWVGLRERAPARLAVPGDVRRHASVPYRADELVEIDPETAA